MISCDTSGTLTLFYYIKIAANLIFIAAPIILVIMSTIDLFGAVTGSYNKSNDLSKAWSKIIKRVIVCIVILILPILINFVMSMVEVGSYQKCFTSATKETIAKLEAEEEAKRKLEEERKKREEEAKRQQQISSSIPSGGSGSVANALGLPYYNQCDPRWKNIRYDIGGGSNGGPATLCSSSCGYTSLAMVVAGLTKDSSINPYAIIKHIRGISDGQLTRRGKGAATHSDLLSSKLSKYGIKGTKISSSSSSIMSALQAGKPVVINVPGHYMTLSISSSGKVVLLEPFTNWADKRRRPGEFNSISEITSIYGRIGWAAAYEKI